MILSWMTVLVADVLVCVAVPRCSAGPPAPDLAAALGRATTQESYAFRVEEKTAAATPAAVVEGEYQKGQPVHFRADGIEFYRKGTALVYRQGDRWQRSKTGIESDPLRIL